MSSITTDIQVKGEERFFKWKEVKEGAVITLLVASALTAASLCIIGGMNQFHFFKSYFHWLSPSGGTYVSSKPWTFANYDLVKAIILLGSGGALIGASVFGIKYFICKKVESKLDEKSKKEPSLEKKRIRCIDSSLAITAIIVSIILISFALFYLYNQQKAVDTQITGWHWDFDSHPHTACWMPTIQETVIGYRVWEEGIARANIAIIVGASLATYGIVNVIHRLSKINGKHKVQPMHIENQAMNKVYTKLKVGA